MGTLRKVAQSRKQDTILRRRAGALIAQAQSIVQRSETTIVELRCNIDNTIEEVLNTEKVLNTARNTVDMATQQVCECATPHTMTRLRRKIDIENTHQSRRQHLQKVSISTLSTPETDSSLPAIKK